MVFNDKSVNLFLLSGEELLGNCGKYLLKHIVDFNTQLMIQCQLKWF